MKRESSTSEVGPPPCWRQNTEMDFVINDSKDKISFSPIIFLPPPSSWLWCLLLCKSPAMDHDCPKKEKKFSHSTFFSFFLAKESQQQPAKAHQADEQLLYSRRKGGRESLDAFYTAVQLLFPSMNKLITPQKTRHIHLMTQLILNCSYVYCILY